MADVPAPAVGPNGLLIPTTTTTRQLGPDVTEKQMSGPGAPAFQDFVTAAQGRLAAQQDIGGEAPTAEQLNAELAEAQANATGNEADAFLAQRARQALPDPFEQPTAGQRIDAELAQVPGSPVQAPPVAEEPKPLTFEQAQDKINAFNAENKAREQAIFQQKQLELQAQLAQLQKQTQDDIAARASEYAKAADAKSSWEDPSAFQRIARALASAMGAYASIVGGGPNPVEEMFRNERNADLERKKMKMAAALEKYKAAGARPEQLQQWYENAQKNLLAQQKAQIDQLDLTSQKLLARYPQAQKASAVAVAKERAEVDKDIAQFALANSGRTVQREGDKVQTVEGKQPGRTGPSESEAKLSLLGKSMQDELAAIRKGAPLSSQDMDTLQSDTLRSESADKTAESGGQVAGAAVGAARTLGVAPKSRYSSLPAEKQKTANAWDNAIEKYARMLTGAGMPAEEARRMARQNGPMAGDTPEQVEFKLQRLEREAARMVSLSGPMAAQRLSDQAPSSPGVAKPQPSKEERAALQAADLILANPKRFPPERVEKARSKKAAYERRYGVANE